MSNEIVPHSGEISRLPSIKEIKEFLLGCGTKLSDEQFGLFYLVCKEHNLNPIKREAYAVPYFNKDKKRYDISVQIGYEVYLKRAEDARQLNGWRAWTESGSDGKPTKAKIKIWRKDWAEPFEHEVLFSEYDQKQKFWITKPETMIKKVAISQGFRLAFPKELGGLPYTDAEMPPGDTIDVLAESTELITTEEFAEKIGGKVQPDDEKRQRQLEFANRIIKSHYFNRDDTVMKYRIDKDLIYTLSPSALSAINIYLHDKAEFCAAGERLLKKYYYNNDTNPSGLAREDIINNWSPISKASDGNKWKTLLGNRVKELSDGIDKSNKIDEEK